MGNLERGLCPPEDDHTAEDMMRPGMNLFEQDRFRQAIQETTRETHQPEEVVRLILGKVTYDFVAQETQGGPLPFNKLYPTLSIDEIMSKAMIFLNMRTSRITIKVTREVGTMVFNKMGGGNWIYYLYLNMRGVGANRPRGQYYFAGNKTSSKAPLPETYTTWNLKQQELQ